MSFPEFISKENYEKFRLHSISELDLSVKSEMVLRSNGIETFGDVLKRLHSVSNLLEFKTGPVKFGAKNVNEICNKCLNYGIVLNGMLSAEDFQNRINIPINQLEISESTKAKLLVVGIRSVYDLVCETMTNASCIALNITKEELNAIRSSLGTLSIHLGDEKIPLEEFTLSDSIIQALHNDEIYTTSDIMRCGFPGILRSSLTIAESLILATTLWRNGFIIEGFPGYNNSGINQKIKPYLLSQSICILDLPEQIVDRLVVVHNGLPSIQYILDLSLTELYLLLQNEMWVDCVKDRLFQYGCNEARCLSAGQQACIPDLYQEKFKKAVHGWAEMWIDKFLEDNINVEESDDVMMFNNGSLALGFHHSTSFGNAANTDVEAFLELAPQITDYEFLGSVIFSRWRFITHWSDGDILAAKDWFLATLKHLSMLTTNSR